MADQTIEIKLILRDELSRQLAPITAAIKDLNYNVDAGSNRAHGGMVKLGGAARAVHREFSALSRLTLGGIAGGGVVAGIVAASKALGEMARQGQQLRYQAEALGTTPAFLERMSDGLLALGVDANTASKDVQNVISTLRDAETHGTKSGLFKALEHGVHGSGIRLWHEIKQQMAGPEGAEGAFKFLISRIEKMAPTGQRAMLKALNISSLAFKDLKEVLPQLHKRIQLSREETQKLAVANANFSIEMGNIGRILGSAVMPGVEKVTSAFAKFLRSENGKKFAAELREWSDAIGAAVGGWINDKGPNGLSANIEDLKKAVAFLKESFAGADQVITDMGASWTGVLAGLVATGFAVWLAGVAANLITIGKSPIALRILGSAAILGAAAAWLKGQHEAFNQDQDHDPYSSRPAYETEDIRRRVYGEEPQTIWQRLRGMWDARVKRLNEQQQGEKGIGKTEPEKRSDLKQEEQERTALALELKDLASEVRQINSYFAIGGPEGSADGRSGFGAGVNIANDLSLPAFKTLMGGGVFAEHHQTVVEAAQRHGVPPSLMASILGFETGYGKSRAVKEFNNPAGLMGRGDMNRTFQKFDSLEEGIDKVGSVQKRIFEQGGRAIAGMGKIYAPVGRGGRAVGNDPNNTNRLWSGGITSLQEKFQDRGFDPGGLQDAVPGPSVITRSLAAEGGGGMGNGSATVDIDIGGLGQPARNPGDLFRPQPLEGAVQMQNATHQQHNPLSFQ